MNSEKRIAVIGAGFLGKALIRSLLARGFDVSVLDRHPPDDIEYSKATWVTGDFRDQSLLRATLRGAFIAYHLVASTVPGDQQVDSARELNEDVVGTIQFIDVCVASGVHRIVFSSSSSVYGVQEKLPIRESAPTNPISSHGVHKLTIEKFLLLAKHLHGIDVRILRISNPYGPGQNLAGRQGFIAIAIGKAILGEELILRDEGRAIRDFIFIDDLARAMVLAGLIDEIPSVLNIGAGAGCSLTEVIQLMGEILGYPVKTINTESRRVDIPASVLDVTLAGHALGMSPVVDLRAGILKTLRFHGVRNYAGKIL
ncbi:MAG: NAD-dependent epimerase/dehydratase family protein [Pseudomonadota bacterium]